MKLKEISITKTSGNKVPFSAEKLHHSLERSGANEEIIKTVVNEVELQLYEGITSKKIYQIAFGLSKKSSKPTVAKYKLKEAIMELGPSCYPFEKYIGEILKYQGFQVKVGEIVKGHCVNHEIDVVAEKDEKHFMIESKYHNTRGTFCDVKITQYIQPRFKDVEEELKVLPEHRMKFHQGWVVTNTRFSDDAIQICAGLYLVGRDYPNNGSLRDQIDTSGLYPINCLPSITIKEKQFLLDKKIVLCKELCYNHHLLFDAAVSSNRMDIVLKDAHTLCKENQI